MRNAVMDFIATVALAGVVVLTVGSCATAQTSPFFERPQGEDDVLPDTVTVSAIERDSSRYLGRDTDGFEYFATRSSTEGASQRMICIVMVADDEVWTSGCSDILPVTVRIPSGKQATLYPGPIPDEIDSGERVGEYVQVEP